MNEKQVEEMVNGLIVDRDYEKSYPRIRMPNVFSISTLSYSMEKQLNWKLYGSKPFTPDADMRMFKGKAVHEFFQNRLEKDKWISEFELLWTTPFKWQNYPYSTVCLQGHVDSLSWEHRAFLEFKSSASAVIPEWAKVQAGTYLSILNTAYPQPGFKGFVVVTNSVLKVHQITPHEAEAGFALVKARALSVAEELDRRKGEGA